MLSQALALTWENREDGRLTRAGYDRAGPGGRRHRGQCRGGLRRTDRGSAGGRAGRAPADDRRGPRRQARSPPGSPRPGAVGAATRYSTRSPGAAWWSLGDGTAEIAHDALLQAWPRLRGWLEEDQSSLILYGQLAEDTARWRQDGKDSSRLYRGVQLAAAREATRVWAADPGRYPALPRGRGRVPAGQRPGRAPGGRWGRSTLAGALVLVLLAALAGAGLAVRSARDDASPAAHRGDVGSGWPRRARRSAPPTRSPRRCSPGPRGGSRRPRRHVTACSSRWPSRCAASWPPVRVR